MNMRDIMILVESTIPTTLYHGTSTLAWKKTDDAVLFLTVSRDDAENYASETAIEDVYNKYGDDFMDENGKEKPAPSEPIIVTFQMADLLKLTGVEFQPDWGWDGSDGATWQESIKAVGSFCIAGFQEAYKGLGKVGPAF